MFWVTIAFRLGGVPFNLDTDIIGLFGLVTLAGAVSAPLTGMLNKRFTSNQVIQFGMTTLVISFILLFFFHSNLVFIILGGLLMEGSRQLIQITMQAQTISLEAEASSTCFLYLGAS
jgi:MFS-type transporter involved in bile tolerance (Atg22 family)